MCVRWYRTVQVQYRYIHDIPVYTCTVRTCIHLNERCEEKLNEILQKFGNQEPRGNLSVSPVMDSYGLHVCIWYHRGRYHRLQEIGCYRIRYTCLQCTVPSV